MFLKSTQMREKASKSPSEGFALCESSKNSRRKFRTVRKPQKVSVNDSHSAKTPKSLGEDFSL